MGRRTIWANQEVVELAKEFVPATDEVWRLQNGSDPECQHFRNFAESGHYRGDRSTRQGTYICTPSGRLLGSMNSHNPQAVVKMMRKALQDYKAMDPAKRLLPPGDSVEPTHRWEASHQPAGMDLTIFSRDLPESCDASESAHVAWNQDRIWFSADELAWFLPPRNSEVKVGDHYPIELPAVQRMTRFNIVDTVRGQTSFYQPQEVQASKLEGWVTAVTDQQIQIRFEGQTRAESGVSRNRELPHGIKTDVLGHATFDRKQKRFEKFEWVALGERWGRTVFNGRHAELEKSPIGFVIRLTPPDAPLIAPAFLFAYDAAWVEHP